MLNPREIDDLRAMSERALPDSATIQERTLVSDGQLGQIETWVDVATVPCRVDENAEGRKRVVGSGTATTGELDLRLPYGTSLNETNRIVVTLDTASPHVRKFEVARIIETSYATLLTVTVTEVRDG